MVNTSQPPLRKLQLDDLTWIITHSYPSGLRVIGMRVIDTGVADEVPFL